MSQQIEVIESLCFKRDRRNWSVPVCLQCLNNVKRLSLFVLAWNFTKRAKFAQNSKSSNNFSSGKFTVAQKSLRKADLDEKVIKLWDKKRSVAKDEQVV